MSHQAIEPPPPKELEPLKPYRTILQQEIRQAVHELQRPRHGLFMSGLTAGFSIGVSLLALATAHTLAGDILSPPALALIMANLYPIGFVIVILSRMDLFTEYTTIAILPVLTRHARTVSLARLWGLIYAGNLVGGAVFAALIVWIGPRLDILSLDTLSLLALQLTDHPWSVILLSAVLAGWLMGLLSWLIAAGRGTISQVAFVWIITMTIGLCHLHHSIIGAVEIFAGFLASTRITLAAVGHFLLWCTLGNAIGGVLFAVAIRMTLKMRDPQDNQQPPSRGQHRRQHDARRSRQGHPRRS